MYLSIWAFILGNTTIAWIDILPKLPTLWIASVFIIATLLLKIPKLNPIIRFIVCFFLGWMFITYQAQHLLAWNLPVILEGKTVLVTGTIESIPKIQDQEMRYIYHLISLNRVPQTTKILLSWRDFPPNTHLTIGDTWQLEVRLKRPHGLENPGGFDYEKWLFSQKIRATGYVVNDSQNIQLSSINYLACIEKFRQQLQEKLQLALKNQTTSGLAIALIMGSQQGITASQWNVMQLTGTNHLMAIAGVHIGFVAGFFYVVMQFLWRRAPQLLLLMPSQQAAALAAGISACIYSALAGFALPTQRALIMLSIFMLGTFLRRQLSPWNAFTLAAGIIVLLDPFALLTVSFWLSFSAVFAIFYGLHYRLNPQGLWWKYGHIQWVITIGLIPISLELFQQTSLISFIANFIAVPAVGIFVLPLCLMGAILINVSTWLATPLLLLAAKMLAWIWIFLDYLSKLPDVVWQQGIPNIWFFLAAIAGVLLLIAPKGFPCRHLGIYFFFPLIFYQPPSPKYGECWLTLLDVGQGLSAVIRTQQHTLVFDTGPKMGAMDDAGQRVILPFLRTLQRHTIDTLIISHGDSDHIGGAYSLLQKISTPKILTSVPQKFSNSGGELCQSGQQWQWDGVVFKMLSPTQALLNQNNNSSCVLSIEVGQHALLLTGDIEKATEKYLLAEGAIKKADVLIAPHHGSQTSSTAAFVQAVQPKYVLFPVGYKNRYRLPSESVVARYKAISAELFFSDQDGAISLKMQPQTGVYAIQKWRDVDKKIWR